MKKITILGSRGMLGATASQYFKRNHWEVQEITRNDFDIFRDSLNELESKISGTEAIINCTGMIAPRMKSTAVEEILIVNAQFPRNLARLGQKLKAPVFHISTDAVFTGKKGQYSEDNYMDCQDLYGLSKASGENSDCMVFRISIIGEEFGEKRSLLEWVRSQAGKETQGFKNHLWNGITTLHLCEVIASILKNEAYETGIFHLFSPQTVTKYELMQKISETYRLNLKIKPTDGPRPCDRSLTSIYPVSKRYCTKSIEVQLQELKLFFESQT